MGNKQVFDKYIDDVRLRCSFVKRNEYLPTIVFLHEPYGSVEFWQSFPDKLGIATRLNTLVYDRQEGRGTDPVTYAKSKSDRLYTDIEMLNKLTESLGLNDIILFGNSYGGLIALLVAAMYPDKVKGIIMEESNFLEIKDSLWVMCPILAMSESKDESGAFKKEMVEAIIESAFFIYTHYLNVTN